MKNQATGEYGNTFRSRWKGYSDGLNNASYYPHELRQMSKGIMESHVIEEDKLFNMKDEISVLLEGLKTNKKRKQDEDETQ
jgi:nickel-dependent lactate racemase